MVNTMIHPKLTSIHAVEYKFNTSKLIGSIVSLGSCSKVTLDIIIINTSRFIYSNEGICLWISTLLCDTILKQGMVDIQYSESTHM